MAKKAFAAVTGASAGIGYELAKQFAKNGYDLAVVAEDDGIFEAASEFEKLGAKVRAYQINLTSRKGVKEFFSHLTGRLDAIALNAGVGVGGAFAENDIEEELNSINLNVSSTVHLAKLAVQKMVKQGEGKILFTSSIASTTPGPFMAVYHGTKAFVQNFAQGIREELKDSGITVTALMPGATQTEFFDRAHLNDTELGVSEKDHPEDVARQGFEAMMAGKDHVVGGSWTNAAEVLIGKVTPETVKAAQARKGAEPGGASKKH